MKFNQKQAAIEQYKKHIRSSSLLEIEIDTLARQIVDSVCRAQYIKRLVQRPQCVDRTNPSHDLFNPLRAVLYYKNRDLDEACWLVFLMVYTGEYSKWHFVRQLYKGLGTWQQVNEIRIEQWLNQQSKVKFGLHRKYESLRDLMAVVTSYIDWIHQIGGHHAMLNVSADTPQQRYAVLYQKMKVLRFGRLAKYDYLGLCGYTQLGNLEADSCYLVGASGPLKGAKRLFGLYPDEVLNQKAMQLAKNLNISYQEIEDALCNWQKSPMQYKNCS